ncbi:MAG: hypothetical protein RJB60_443, partial [Pseudomonadota bacterium]
MNHTHPTSSNESSWQIGGITLHSRFLLGTAQYP